MRPTFAHGDRVLVRRAGLGELRTGLIVVVEKPAESGAWVTPPPRWPGRSREWMIKRVAALPSNPTPDVPMPMLPFPSKLAELADRAVPAEKLVVLGDNPAGSYDSRHLGYFPADRLLGIVLRPIHPAGLGVG